MKRFSLAWLAGLLLLTTLPATAQRYAARRDGDIVHLTDTATDTRVSIAPSIGNIAFRMIVKGHDVLRWPHADMAAFKANPNMTGIPFMGPWINRLDEQAFYANGRRYPFDMTLGNVRGDIPIHGFVTSTSEWRVVSVDAGRMRRDRHQPARVLPPAVMDEAVAVRAHDRDDLPPVGRHARSRDDDREPERGADAGLGRIPSRTFSSPTLRETSGRSRSARART